MLNKTHSQIISNNIKPQTIYNPEIINRRKSRIVNEDKSLWDFANLYFQPLDEEIPEELLDEKFLLSQF